MASGNGSTAETFIRACITGNVDGEVILIICNNADAGIIGRIADLNEEFNLHIEAKVINGTTHPLIHDEVVEKGCQTKTEEAAILATLRAGNFDLIVLMGYMKRVGPTIVHEFGWRPEYTSPYQAKLLNTHPGLLPDSIGYFGVHVQEYVLEKGYSESGQTLHVVSENYDEGPTVSENRVTVLHDDTPESLFRRVQAAEKQNLPSDIDAFMKSRWQYMSGIVKA